VGTEQFLHRPLLGLLSNLPVLLGALALLLPLWPPFVAAYARRPALWLAALFLLTRIVFLALVAGRLGHVSADLTNFFLPQAEAVHAGQVPNLDFPTSYAPLFPYVLATACSVFGGGVRSIFALFLLADLGALLAVAAAARRTPLAAWFYAAAPIVWYFLVRYAQDETLLAAVLAAAYLLHERRREPAAALVLGLGFVATKFTFGIFCVPFWLAARRKVAFALVAAIPVVVVAVGFTALGASVLAPLRYESASMGDGPGLWRLPLLFTSLTVGRYAALVPLTGLAAVWLWMWRRRISLPAGLVLTGCVFFVLSPKAFPMYAVPFWPFVALWLAADVRPARVVTAAALNLLLGCWWYLDAGGINGMFGPGVRALAVLWTAAVPVVLLILVRQAARVRSVTA